MVVSFFSTLQVVDNTVELLYFNMIPSSQCLITGCLRCALAKGQGGKFMSPCL